MIEKEYAIINEELKIYPKARTVLEALRKSPEVKAWLEQGNVNVVRRLGFNDHGWVHAEIVTASSVRMLGILLRRGIVPGIVKDHAPGMFSGEDAMVVSVCAAYLHDLGNAIHRENHELHSTILARAILENILPNFYPDVGKRQFVIGEVLHSIYSHDKEKCLTLEAGVLRMADGTDMAGGRSRLSLKLRGLGIHVVSAQAIKDVQIVENNKKGDVGKPIKMEIAMANLAGIFQVEKLLLENIPNSGMGDYIEIIATVAGGETGKEKKIVKKITF